MKTWLEDGHAGDVCGLYGQLLLPHGPHVEQRVAPIGRPDIGIGPLCGDRGERFDAGGAGGFGDELRVFTLDLNECLGSGWRGGHRAGLPDRFYNTFLGLKGEKIF